MRFRNSSMREQMKEAAARRNMLAHKYLETWSRHDVGERLIEIYSKDPARALRTAWAIQMQEKAIMNMREETIRSQFGTTPENVLKIVRIGAANSNRANLVTEVPLETTDDAIFYLKYTAGKSVRGETAGTPIMESVQAYGPGEQYPYSATSTGDGIATSFSFTGIQSPIRPYSVQVLVANTFVGTDNGTGSFTGATINTSSSTIDYSAGTATVVFTSAPEAGAVVQLLASFDSEVESNYPQIQTVDIDIDKRRFRAAPVPLGYNISGMAKLTLGTAGYGDGEEIMLQGVGLYHAKMKDYRAIARLRSVALSNPVTTFDTDFAAAGEVSDISHTQKLKRFLRKLEGDVQNDVGRGELNRVVVGYEAAAYMERIEGFTEDNSQPRVGGVYLFGRIGNMEIYKVVQDAAAINLIGKNEIMLGYKSDVEGDVAVAYGVLTEMSDQLTYPTHNTVGQLSAVEDNIVFETKFQRLVQLDNLVF